MDHHHKISVLAIFFAFVLVLFMDPSITGFSVAARFESFFTGNSLSSLGPVVIVSLLMAAGVTALIEVRK